MSYFATFLLARCRSLLVHLPEVGSAFGSNWRRLEDRGEGWQLLDVGQPRPHEWPNVGTGPAGNAPINGWSVQLTLPSGAAVTNAWNANRNGSSGTVQFSNVSYNGRVNAGESTEFGFQGTGAAAGLTPVCTAA
jgi:hypothetical protein